eukprot:scaffold116166_cov24-Phaeocystis_antarctica.AAC.1
MTARATAGSTKVTKPKPRDCPVPRSRTTCASETCASAAQPQREAQHGCRAASTCPKLSSK